jgi:predicted O-methyltransferase YrrM
MPHEHPAHDHPRHGHAHPDPTAMVELLELDRAVLQPYVTEVMTWLAAELGDGPRRIVDLGPGTGSGTIALARQFPAAEVVAVDRSPELLEVLTDNVEAAGLADRVRARQANLDGGWPDVGAIDLAWASLSLHEVAEPERLLADVLAALRPGGALVVTEMDAPPRFLPDGLGVGQPGLEVRLHAALRAAGAGGDPHPDWGPQLREAGFDVTTRRFDIDLTSEQPAAVGYALAYLRMLRPHLADHVTADDLATLDQLLEPEGPHSLQRRDDVVVRGVRTTWLARRPEA